MDHNDENYNSASDDDFNPEDDVASDAGSSTSNEEGQSKKPKKRNNDAEALDFDNSGDEATVQRGLRKKRKKGHDKQDEDEGGEGGFVKTRAQRQTEAKEKKPLVEASKSTLDIDAIWSQMSKSGTQDLYKSAEKHHETTQGKSSEDPTHDGTRKDDETSVNPVDKHNSGIASKQLQTKQTAQSNTVTIKRSYEFAGEKIDEERIVPADSAEAKLYLQEQERQKDESLNEPKRPRVNRPMKRRSKFDVPDQNGAAIPPNPLLNKTKLNTIDKSKLDWAAHVDQEGLGEELDEHRKAKDTYLGRMDFLGRMDAKRDEDFRNSKT